MLLFLALLASSHLSSASSDEPERSLERCGDARDGYLPSGITSEDSALVGNDALLSIDYPGYMTVTSIDFEGMSQTPALDTWQTTINSNCSQNNNIQTSIPVADLVSWGNPSDGVVEFSMIVTATYWSYDRVFGRYSEDTITKEIQVELEAPTSYVVTVTFSLHPDSNLLQDVEWVTWDDESRVLSVGFSTFVHEAFLFDGVYRMESDFFQQGTDTLLLDTTTAYVHPDEGAGMIQNWTLSFQNVSCVPNRVHTETFRLWMQTAHTNMNGGYFQEAVDFHVAVSDGDCLPTKIPLDTDPEVEIGDENQPEDDQGRKIYWLNEPLHMMITFDTTVEPKTTDLKGFQVKQEDQYVCPDCHLEDAFSFKCESCADGSLKSPGNMVNISMFLDESIFTLTESDGTETVLEMEFEFAYDSRRELRTIRRQLAVRETNADYGLDMIIQGYDCSDPEIGKGLYGETHEEACAKGGVSKYHCSRTTKTWDLLSRCETAAASVSDDDDGGLLDEFSGISWIVVAVAGLLAICCMCCVCYLFRRDKRKVVVAGEDVIELQNYDQGYNEVSQRDNDPELIAKDVIAGVATPGGMTPGAMMPDEPSQSEEQLGFWGSNTAGGLEGEGEITGASTKRSPAPAALPASSKRHPTTRGTNEYGEDEYMEHYTKDANSIDYVEGPAETQKRSIQMSKNSGKRMPSQMQSNFENPSTVRGSDPLVMYCYPSEGHVSSTTTKAGSGGAEVEDSVSADDMMSSPSGGDTLMLASTDTMATAIMTPPNNNEPILLSGDFTSETADDLDNELYGTSGTNNNQISPSGGGSLHDIDNFFPPMS